MLHIVFVDALDVRGLHSFKNSLQETTEFYCIHGANSILFDQIDVTSCLVYVSVYSTIFSSYFINIKYIRVFILISFP